MTDAANATTTTYDAALDLPSVVTDAEGNTSCYKYDHRGRKIAEWGTAIQPACFGYDDMGNMTTLCTFRAGTEIISSDPTERTDYDQTTWTFHPATGLELSKTYADGTAVVKAYDAYNRLATETDARGNVKTHSYEHARGLHLSTTYSLPSQSSEGATAGAASNARSFSYNHLGQLTQLTDDSGVRSFSYNTYGERESDSLAVDGDTHLVTELRDAFGRSTGYTYAKNGSVQQTVSTGYGTDGRINSAGFLHGGEMKQFGYEYLQGTNLLHKLVKPNGMTLTQSYETQRDLISGMAYHRGTTLVAQREYTYDILGRPSARNTARQGAIVNDSFTHNTRSELVEAQVNGKDYEYAYDNVGNRTAALEESSSEASSTECTANALNQYTSISENGDSAFVPQFDADGNQTLIKTETGIWSAIYNVENRPVCFTNADTGTVITCAYDSMGRRSFKKVTVNGTVTLHQRFIYRGYLQIACIDLTRTHHPCLWLITWDSTQPIATRPLAIQKDGTWYTYGWDLTKNVCEIFGVSGYIVAAYRYRPFGNMTVSGNIFQPIQWSSEYYDYESDLVYYNYRYYNANNGRWITRDFEGTPEYMNFYSYCKKNNASINTDFYGLLTIIVHGTILSSKPKGIWWTKDGMFATNLNAILKDVWETKNKKIKISGEFSWSGKNDHNERLKAGKDLADFIRKIRCLDSNEPINIVAHSHGGNVVLSALTELYNNRSGGICKKKNIDYTVDNVVLLGTPHFYIAYNSGTEYVYMNTYALEMIKGKLYNIYTRSDLTQTILADTSDGISKSSHGIRSNELPFWKIHYLYVDRGVLHPKIENIEVEMDFFSDSHGTIHSSEMGTYIGELLTNEKPTWEINNYNLGN